MQGDIIFLRGASSAGKSTIAKALQKSLEAPFLHVSIDHFRDAGVLPLDDIAHCQNWKDARPHEAIDASVMLARTS